MHRALELVRREAARHGLIVESTEIVGLVPLRAVADTAQFYLQLEGWSADEQILEILVDRAGRTAGEMPGRGPLAERRLGGVLDALASSEPTPGGGSAAALAGAAGAALVAMVARLTAGKKGYEATEARTQQIVAEADAARAEFLALADRDAAAFDEVIGAYRLPKESDADKAARSAAIQRALGSAAEVPLRVAELAVSLLEPAREATGAGIPTAASDGAAAGQLLFAAAQAALRNVEINVASMKDPDQVRRMRESAASLQRRSEELLAATNETFRARLP